MQFHDCRQYGISYDDTIISVKYKAKLLTWPRLIPRIDLYMDEVWKIYEIGEFDLYSASTYRPENTVHCFFIFSVFNFELGR